MFIAVYEYWGNIDMITKILFQMTFAADSVILTSYFIVRGRKLALLFDMLETNFVFYIDNVVAPENKLKILKEASRKSVIMTGILVSIFSSVILGWICSPLVLQHIYKSTGNDMENNSEDISRYYCYVLWLPKRLAEPSMYVVIYIFQALSVLISVSQYTACNIILFSLMFHISTHFKLLVSAFENMGQVVLMEKVGMEEPISSLKCSRLVMDTKFSGGFNHYPYATACKSVKTIASIDGGKPRSSYISQSQENIRSPVRDEISGKQMSEQKSIESVTGAALHEERMKEYFINCVRYHQAILE
jgi:hypothetical protein